MGLFRRAARRLQSCPRVVSRWLGDRSEGGDAHGPHSARGRVHELAALGAASRCGRIKKPGAGSPGRAPGAAGCGQRLA